jgi:hypothetical protein
MILIKFAQLTRNNFILTPNKSNLLLELVIPHILNALPMQQNVMPSFHSHPWPQPIPDFPTIIQPKNLHYHIGQPNRCVKTFGCSTNDQNLKDNVAIFLFISFILLNSSRIHFIMDKFDEDK